MRSARARRIADRGLALAGELIVRGARLGVDAIGVVLERGTPPAAERTRPAPPAPAARPRPAPPAPTPAPTPPPPAAEEEHVTVEATLVETVGAEREPGADVRIEEPWPGYDGMNAREIAQRVRHAGSELAAAVRMYEAANKDRVTVLEAAERELSG